MTSSHLAVSTISIVIIMKTPIIHHSRNVRMVMLREKEEVMMEKGTDELTECSPLWLLYVSKKTPSPTK